MPEKETDIFLQSSPHFLMSPSCLCSLSKWWVLPGQHRTIPPRTLHSCSDCTHFLQLAGDPNDPLILGQLSGTFTKRWIRRTLQSLVSLKGRPLSIVNESKLNRNKPLHSGQIFQSAVKSYLRLTGCDVSKWYMVTIVETAALLLQSCLRAQVVVNRRKPALKNINVLVGSEGSDFL